MGLINNDHLFFVDEVKEVDLCGSKVYQLTGSEFSVPTDFKRLSYEKHNLKTCEDCRNNYAKVLARMTEKFRGFPNCCEPHARLVKAPWFNRKDFENAPKLYADKLLFTWHHILNFVDEENWKDEIFDFIEYIVITFGSFPVDYGEPLFFRAFTDELSELVKGLSGHTSKKQQILQFIAGFQKNDKNKNSDLNVAMSTYNEWFKTFPFELSFFQPVKAHYAKNIPILGQVHTNKYLGLTKGRPITKEKLIDFLLKVTDSIITQINTSVLYEQGLISDIDKIEMELVLQKRKQKLKMGYLNQSKDPDTRYRKILKEWFKDELTFIKEIRPVAERISENASKLYDAILAACGKMQENKVFWDADENTRTRQVLDLLSTNYFAKDQSLYGASESGIKQGQVDGVIFDEKGVEHFVEAFNLSTLSREIISRHVNKLELNYDAKGLVAKYVLVYCNIKDDTFSDFYSKYFEFLKNDMPFKFKPMGFQELETNYANIRVIKSTHQREGRDIVLFHILIKMPF